MNNFDYFILTDTEHKNLLVRLDGATMSNESKYNMRAGAWEPYKFFNKYFDSHSTFYKQYETLNEHEAAIYISRLYFLKFYQDGFSYPDSATE
jgi:hypothetical protein